MKAETSSGLGKETTLQNGEDMKKRLNFIKIAALIFILAESSTRCSNKAVPFGGGCTTSIGKTLQHKCAKKLKCSNAAPKGSGPGWGTCLYSGKAGRGAGCLLQPDDIKSKIQNICKHNLSCHFKGDGPGWGTCKKGTRNFGQTCNSHKICKAGFCVNGSCQPWWNNNPATYKAKSKFTSIMDA